MRILLIDDSPAYHEEFADLLARSNVTYSALDIAHDAEQGEHLLRADGYDCYFIDFRLPARNGLSLVETARQVGNVKPMIMLTAFDNPAIDAEAERAGASDYLAKGEFSPEALGRTIRYARRDAATLAAARQAELRLRLAQEAAGIGTWDWGITDNTLIWSPKQYELLGVDQAITGMALYDAWRQAIHPEDRDAAEAAMLAALAGQSPFDVVFRVIRSDRGRLSTRTNTRWLRARAEVQRDPSGAPARMVGVHFDVTEQRDALMALEARHESAVEARDFGEQQLRAYFENSPDCLFHLNIAPDKSFRYVSVNPAGLAAVGCTLEQLAGKTPLDALGPEYGAVMIDALSETVRTGQPYSYMPTFKLGGKTIIYDAVYMPLRNKAGEITDILGHARDVSDRRRLEDALQQAQKMEALGQLAGGVAHDFNNLLAGALGCFQLLRKHVTSDAGHKLLDEGHRVVERGTSLTERLLAFSRQQPLTTEPVDVNAMITSLADMLARTVGNGIRVGSMLAEDLWPANTDRNQLEIAILNLAINARDAMPAGGTLVLATRNEVVGHPPVAGLARGRYVVIDVTDTGTGMTPDVLARVLEPFFTTKEPGKGTGLGLSMVYGLLHQIGGLGIDSEPGLGTTVHLYLPKSEPAAEPAAATVAPT